jgi:hypothetical protein
MDRRITPFSGRVAAESLRGSVAAEAYVTPVPRQIAGNPFLLAEPGSARDRQCLAGDHFGLIETRGDWAYGQAARDDYCGWLPATALTDPVTPTHRVNTRTTWLYPTSGVRPPALADLHFNARVLHLGTEGRWDRVSCGGIEGFVPSAHLRPLGEPETDPVAVLKRFEGTPYVWAGNTGFGIDCSGLVQAALLACGIPCPGDSDLQEKALGRRLGPDEALRARDLIFWKGHVAMLADDATLLHANGHAMCVAWEPVAEAIARIEAAGHPMLSARRL